MSEHPPRTAPRPELLRLAERIANARQKRGMSQRELSRKVGLWGSAIQKLESGQRGLQVTELIDIAAVLNEDPRELLHFAISDPNEVNGALGQDLS